VLIVFLALWLVAISILLRFFAVSAGSRCTTCGGEVELWPDRRRCSDCGRVPPERSAARSKGPAWPSAEADPVHRIAAAALAQTRVERARAERLARASAPARYQRATTGSTRSANNRTLS
jgi:hypothetical protein